MNNRFLVFLRQVPLGGIAIDLDKLKFTVGALLFGYGLAGIVLISLVIWFFFERRIVTPIKILEKRATDISVGKNLDEKIVVTSNDEVGALAQAVERMRVSVTKLMAKFNK